MNELDAGRGHTRTTTTSANNLISANSDQPALFGRDSRNIEISALPGPTVFPERASPGVSSSCLLTFVIYCTVNLIFLQELFKGDGPRTTLPMLTPPFPLCDLFTTPCYPHLTIIDMC